MAASHSSNAFALGLGSTCKNTA